MGKREPEQKQSCSRFHPHNFWCYRAHKCRCKKCRAANSASNSKGSRSRRIRSRQAVIITAKGCRRRLRALARIGYGSKEVSLQCGVSVDHLTKIRGGVVRNVSTDTHIAVSRVYDRLHMTPSSHKSAAQVRANAVKKNYCAPMHWVDIDSDGKEGYRVHEEEGV